MELLFDTNILIYHLNGQLNETGTTLLKQGLLGQGSYSVIARIEVLGFDQPEAAEIQASGVWRESTYHCCQTCKALPL